HRVAEGTPGLHAPQARRGRGHDENAPASRAEAEVGDRRGEQAVANVLSRLGVPAADLEVFPHAQDAAVRSEGGPGEAGAAGVLELVDQPAGAHVPQTDALASGHGEELVTVRAECRPLDGAAGGLQGGGDAPGARLDDLRGLSVRGDQEVLAIRGDRSRRIRPLWTVGED